MEDIKINIENARFRIRSISKLAFEETVSDDTLHMHYYPEFHYIYSGTEYIKTQAEIYKLTEGDLCIIPPAVHHTPTGNSLRRVCFNIIVEKVDAEDPSAHDYYSYLKNYYQLLRSVVIVNDPYISKLMERYYELTKKENDSEISECQRALLLINILMKTVSLTKKEKKQKAKRSDKSDTYSDRKWIIEEYISSNYNKSASILELAKILHIGERRTRDLVKNLMGYDFKELIIRQRMSIAELLIKEKKYSLEDISRMVGYTSYSGFYVAYKNYKGKIFKDFEL